MARLLPRNEYILNHLYRQPGLGARASPTSCMEAELSSSRAGSRGPMRGSDFSRVASHSYLLVNCAHCASHVLNTVLFINTGQYSSILVSQLYKQSNVVCPEVEGPG